MNPRFHALTLVDTFHPGEAELAALRDVSENPPDVIASVRAALADSGTQDAG